MDSTRALNKTCPHCRAIVSASYDACPHCQTDLTKVRSEAARGRVTMFGGSPATMADIVPLQKGHAGSAAKYQASASMQSQLQAHDAEAAECDLACGFSFDKAHARSAPKKPWE